MNLPKTNNDFLDQLKGRTLASVEFVQDYVQFRFDGFTLTAYTWPCLTVGETIFSWGERAYKDSLCAEIGIAVTGTHFAENREITICFEDGAILTVSLMDKDYRGPEAAVLVADDGSIWVT